MEPLLYAIAGARAARNASFESLQLVSSGTSGPKMRKLVLDNSGMTEVDDFEVLASSAIVVMLRLDQLDLGACVDDELLLTLFSGSRSLRRV